MSSFFTAAALGYVRESNAIAKQKAADKREDELLAEQIEARRQQARFEAKLAFDNNMKLNEAQAAASLAAAEQENKQAIGRTILQSALSDEANIDQFNREQSAAESAARLLAEQKEAEKKADREAAKLANQQNVFSELPSKVQSELISRGGDDYVSQIFGSNFGMGATELAALLSDTENSFSLGDVTVPLPQPEMGDPKQVETGIRNFEQFLTENPEAIAELTKPENAAEAKAFVGNIIEVFNTNWHKDNSKVSDDGRVLESKYYGWGTGNLKKMYDLAVRLGVFEMGGGFNPPPNLVDEKPNAVFLPTGSDDESVEGVSVDIAALSEEFNTSPESLTNMSSYWRMPQGAGQLFSNLDVLTYGDDANTPLNAMLSNDSVLSAVAAGSLLVKAGSKDLFLIKGAAAKTVLQGTEQILTAVGGGDPSDNYAGEDKGAMVRAMFTITKPPPQQPGTPPAATTYISGTEYARIQKYDVEGHRDQSKATDESVILLEELKNTQISVGTTGIVARGELFARGVVGQFKDAKTVFFGDTPGSEIFTQNLHQSESGEPPTNAKILYDTAVGILGKDRMKNLTKMDALRLTLAAKMARAVDPSGRLSNQDFEIQLDRLGGTGFFTSQEGNLEKLQTVIDEFKRRQESQQLLTSILDKPEITTEDRRFIKAHGAVSKVIKYRRKAQMRVEVNENNTRSADGSFDITGLPTVDMNGVTLYVEGEQIFTEDGTDISDEFYTYVEAKNRDNSSGSN